MLATRITISLPHGLEERIKAVKGKFNVSKICQEALEFALKIRDLQAPVDDAKKAMDKLIAKRDEEISKHNESLLTR